MKEVVILAGGFGTRLQHLLPDVPKALAPIAGKPFLFYLIEYLIGQKVDRYIFALGYKADQIILYLNAEFSNLDKTYIIEEHALGTGGAIRNAAENVKGDFFIVINGDTYFPLSISSLINYYFEKHADIVIATKQMLYPHRYGTMSIEESDRIINFNEKKSIDFGIINAGVYIISKEKVLTEPLGLCFSFEQDVLEKKNSIWNIFAMEADPLFIDIGIPEDFRRAQLLFSEKLLLELKLSKSKRTLFLDRDGIINELIPGNYVKLWDEFRFTNNVILLLKSIQAYFSKIIIITNQQGIGKGLMTENDLNQIHKSMLNVFNNHDLQIHGIYFCPHLAESNCNCRKPKSGLFIKAKHDFPDIEFENSYFIGDSVTDILAAKDIKCKSIALCNKNNFYSLKEAEPDHMVFYLSDVIPKLLSDSYT